MSGETTGLQHACNQLAAAGEQLMEHAFDHTPDVQIDAIMADVLEAYAKHVMAREERNA